MGHLPKICQRDQSHVCGVSLSLWNLLNHLQAFAHTCLKSLNIVADLMQLADLLICDAAVKLRLMFGGAETVSMLQKL